MTSNEILKADVLDIIFDHRNKQYGAYMLRRYYGNRLGVALGVTVSVAFLLLLILKPGGRAESRKAYEGEVMMTTVVFPKQGIKVPEVIPPATPRAHKAIAEQRFTSNIAITKRPVIEPLATQEELLNARVGTRTVEGDPELIQGRTLPPAPPWCQRKKPYSRRRKPPFSGSRSSREECRPGWIF